MSDEQIHDEHADGSLLDDAVTPDTSPADSQAESGLDTSESVGDARLPVGVQAPHVQESFSGAPDQVAQPGQPVQPGQYAQPQYQQYPQYGYQQAPQVPSQVPPAGQTSQLQSQQSQPQQPQYQQQFQYGYQPMQQPFGQMPGHNPAPFGQPAPLGPAAYGASRNPAWLRYLREHRKVFSRIGFALIMVALVWNVLTGALYGWLEPVLSNAGMGEGDISTLLSDVPNYLIATPLALLVFRTLPKVKRKTSSMKPGAFLAMFSLTFPISVIGSDLGSWISDALSSGRSSDRLQDAITGTNPVLMVLTTVVFAPLVEEWLFRKQIIDHTQQYGEKTAIVFSALAFGLYHANLYQFFYATGLGLVMGYVYVRTGKMRYNVGLHMLFNLFGGALPQLCQMGLSSSVMDDLSSGNFARMQAAVSVGGFAAVMLILLQLFNVVMFVVGIVVAIVNYRKLRFHRAPDELPKGARVSVVLANPGVIAALVMFTALTFAMVWA